MPRRRVIGVPVEVIRRPERLVFVVPLALSLLCIVVGGAGLLEGGGSVYSRPATGLLAVGLIVSLVLLRREAHRWDRGGILLVVLCLGANLMTLLMPEFLIGEATNGVGGRSLILGIALVLLSALTASYAVRSLLGRTPSRPAWISEQRGEEGS